MGEVTTNDFVLKFANVNGSGSASANGLCAKAIFRMGVPLSAKNIFPSNIQGLPTWYEITVSEQGYTARREMVDVMVAMNPQTYDKDVAAVCPGGVLIYDNTLPRNFGRDDIEIIGIPLAQMTAAAYDDPRQRQLFKNITYLGALAALIEIDLAVIEQLLNEQFKSKPKLVPLNMDAVKRGYDWVVANLDYPLNYRLKHANKNDGKVMMNGNEAAGLGCVYAGATVASWYPITPSTSLAESFEKYCNKFRRNDDGSLNAAIVQAEDELAAVGMAVGANWNGARAFTATSGPGISLMSEFIGLAYFAEVPLVLFDIQRGGPSTGMPTRTQQSDILTCAYASHGDTRHVLLFPGDPNECFSMAADAFDLAERLQTPIFVMSDLDIGMNDWVCDELAWDDSRLYDRGKVMSRADLDSMDFARYRDVDGDAIPYRTLPGTHPTKGAFFTRGTSHTDTGGYTEDGKINADMLMRINAKHETAKGLIPKPIETKRSASTKVGMIFVGSTEGAITEALDRLAGEHQGINQLRIRAFPFTAEVDAFVEAHDHVFVIEQNRDGQLHQLLIMEGEYPVEKLISITNVDGEPLTANFMRGAIEETFEANPALKEAVGAPVTAVAQNEEAAG